MGQSIVGRVRQGREGITTDAFGDNIGSKASAASKNERNDSRHPACLCPASRGDHRVCRELLEGAKPRRSEETK